MRCNWKHLRLPYFLKRDLVFLVALERRVEQLRSYYLFTTVAFEHCGKRKYVIVDGGFLEYTIFQELCGNHAHAQAVVTRHSLLSRVYALNDVLCILARCR